MKRERHEFKVENSRNSNIYMPVNIYQLNSAIIRPNSCIYGILKHLHL